MQNTQLTQDEKSKGTFKRLLLAKELYMHALTHSQKHDTLDRMIAVHDFHNAIEIVLKAIVIHLGIVDEILEKPRQKYLRDVSFPDLIKKLNDNPKVGTKGNAIPYASELLSMNEYRNQIQHDALEPSDDVIERCRVWASAFMEQIYDTQFCVDINDISRIDYITDLRIRRLLKIAGGSISNKDFKKCIWLSRLTFDYAIEPLLILQPSNLYSLAESLLAQDQRRDDITIVFGEVSEELNEVKLRVFFLERGINTLEYEFFHENVPNIFIADGHGLYTDWQGQVPSEDTARSVLEFVTSTLIKLQEAGESPVLTEEWDSIIDGEEAGAELYNTLIDISTLSKEEHSRVVISELKRIHSKWDQGKLDIETCDSQKASM